MSYYNNITDFSNLKPGVYYNSSKNINRLDEIRKTINAKKVETSSENVIVKIIKDSNLSFLLIENGELLVWYDKSIEDLCVKNTLTRTSTPIQRLKYDKADDSNSFILKNKISLKDWRMTLDPYELFRAEKGNCMIFPGTGKSKDTVDKKITEITTVTKNGTYMGYDCYNVPNYGINDSALYGVMFKNHFNRDGSNKFQYHKAITFPGTSPTLTPHSFNFSLFPVDFVYSRKEGNNVEITKGEKSYTLNFNNGDKKIVCSKNTKLYFIIFKKCTGRGNNFYAFKKMECILLSSVPKDTYQISWNNEEGIVNFTDLNSYQESYTSKTPVVKEKFKTNNFTKWVTTKQWFNWDDGRKPRNTYTVNSREKVNINSPSLSQYENKMRLTSVQPEINGGGTTTNPGTGTTRTFKWTEYDIWVDNTVSLQSSYEYYWKNNDVTFLNYDQSGTAFLEEDSSTGGKKVKIELKTSYPIKELPSSTSVTQTTTDWTRTDTYSGYHMEWHEGSPKPVDGSTRTGSVKLEYTHTQDLDASSCFVQVGIASDRDILTPPTLRVYGTDFYISPATEGYTISSPDYFGDNRTIESKWTQTGSFNFYTENEIRLFNKKYSTWTVRAKDFEFNVELENPYYLIEDYTSYEYGDFEVGFKYSSSLGNFLAQKDFKLWLSDSAYESWSWCYANRNSVSCTLQDAEWTVDAWFEDPSGLYLDDYTAGNGITNFSYDVW